MCVNVFVYDLERPHLWWEKKQHLYCEASIHDFVNGIGTSPALILAASNHLSKAGHCTCQDVMSSRNSAPWTGFIETLVILLNEAKREE